MYEGFWLLSWFHRNLNKGENYILSDKIKKNSADYDVNDYVDDDVDGNNKSRDYSLTVYLFFYFISV